MDYSIKEASEVLKCSYTTFVKVLEKSYIVPIKEVRGGRVVTRLNQQMINTLIKFKFKYDQISKNNKLKCNKDPRLSDCLYDRHKSDPTETFNRVKNSEYFGILSTTFSVERKI